MHACMCYMGCHRSVGTQPVSGVLSSHVTAISDTSSEFAVLLTFKYSVEVGSLIHSVTCYYIVINFVY